MRTWSMLPVLLAAFALLATDTQAQRDLSPQVRAFVRMDAPVIALTNVRVIDGTGRPAREGQTVVLRDGDISYVGPAAGAPIEGAEILDLTGHTVTPGFVMLHEHMFYPAGNAMYNQLGYSFPRLYLAGGATTIRTAGSVVPYADLSLRASIDAGQTPGPRMHVTAPYLNGPGLGIPAVHALSGPDEARRMVEYWADVGATSFKAYMHISRDELRAAVEAAHARGLKVTGHLCSVTFREAADLGIDNLEHAFFASTDFVADKKPDQCPPGASASLADLDPRGDAARSLIRHLIDSGVALTSTLTVFETSVPGRPRAPDAVLDAMVPDVRDLYLRTFSQIAGNEPGAAARRFRTMMEMEVEFFRAGGLLVAGTDPTGYGGVVAGWSNQRMIELLVEAGLSPVEAIQVSTLNGAVHLGVADRVGTIAPGMSADLVVVRGDPAARIQDIRNVEIVFKDGIGYDPARLIAAARGSVGIR
jgi:imidazolonepropionase-like amidohydrolase